MSLRFGEIHDSQKFLTHAFQARENYDSRDNVTEQDEDGVLSEVQKAAQFVCSDFELSRYFPIALVSCIEGYFRLVFADLINHGAPYKDNAAKFEIKFTIDTAVSLERHSVTLGEFVAHLLPLNNLDDIESNMTTLIGESFLKLFK